MTYDPKNNSVYLVSGDAYTSVYTWKEAPVNFYMLRQSQRDLVGGYVYVYANGIKDSDVFYGIGFDKGGSSVTIGAEANGGAYKTVLDIVNGQEMLGSKPSGSHGLSTYWGNITAGASEYTHLTVGINFKADGIVDFANGTGYVGMGEDIKLQTSVLNVSNIGNIYAVLPRGTKPVYSATTDVAVLFSEGTLTVEGSLFADINASAVTERESIDYRNASAMVIDRRRVVVAGLRGQNISLELNMAGNVNATVGNQVFLDFVKTSYENVAFQAVGLFADGSIGAGELGLSNAEGSLHFGNAVGGVNSHWTGTVNAVVSDIVLGTDIYMRRQDYVSDAAGNPFLVNGRVQYFDYVERDPNSFGNRAGTDPETELPIKEPWKWALGDKGGSTFVDGDFLEDSTSTFVRDNVIAAQGVSGKTVELGNMATSGSISATVKDVLLLGEYAVGTGLNFFATYDTNTGAPTNDTAKHMTPYHGTNQGIYTIDSNSTNNASTTVIDADTLKINGDFFGTLNADLSNVKTLTTKTEFKYEYREWLYDVYEIQVGTSSGAQAVTATNFISDVQRNPDKYYNRDLQIFVDPVSRYQIDLRYDANGDIIGTGYLLSPSGDGTYEDPVTGGYVDINTGFVYRNTTFIPENQLYRGIEIAAAGDRVYSGLYSAYQSSVSGAIGGNHRGVYNWLYDNKDTDGNNILNVDSFVIEGDANSALFGLIVDRTITQTSDLDNSGISGSAYGINATTSITVDGHFDGLINVKVADNVLDSLTVYGIKTGTIKAVNGLFAPEVHITVDNYVSTSSDSKASIIGLDAGTLTAEALAGTYYVYGGTFGKETFAFSINNFDSSFDDDANPTTFNIIADVYAQAGVFKNAGSWDLRFSGDIYAGKTLDHNGNWITVKDQYIYDSSGESSNNENFDFAAGAEAFGNWHFGLGFDTLTIDSNAHLQGNIYVGKNGQMGAFNLLFNLNDQVLKEKDRNQGKPILEGQFLTSDGVGTASSTMIAISLNDVVLEKDAQGNIESHSYTILGGQTQNFVDSLETVQLKYDGLSLETKDLEGVDLFAEIGYYNGEGIWIATPVGNGTGYEFRQSNFTATIGVYNGVKNAAGKKLGNVIRVYDRNNMENETGGVIFEAHSEFETGDEYDTGSVKIVVDILPDVVELPDDSGNTYYTTVIKTGIENLHEWYNTDDKTLTVTFDDHSVDVANMSYHFEYYIQTLDENGNVVDETNTILREINKTGDLNPRTAVTLNGINSNQKVIWRVRQILGGAIENSGEWYSVDDHTFERPQDLYQIANGAKYTLEWKNELTAAQSTVYTYKVTYTLIDAAGRAVEKVVYAPVTDARKINCSIDTEGKRLSGWNVVIVDINDIAQSEVAVYQNLQIEKVVLTAPSGFDLRQDENGKLVFSWDNSNKSSDISYKLEYCDGDGKWTTVYVKPEDAVTARVSHTVSMALPTSSNPLNWRVTAYQKNGEETRLSTVCNIISKVQVAKNDSTVFVTTVDDSVGVKDDVTFTWCYDSDIDAAFLLEYALGSTTKAVTLSRETLGTSAVFEYYNEAGAIEYVYEYDKTNGTERWKFMQNGVELTDTSKISFRCKFNGGVLNYDAATGKVHYTIAGGSSASGNIEWRVRELDDDGNVTVENKWQIYESEDLCAFGCEYVDVVDKVSNEKTKTAVLTFESNEIGSSYRLEYVVVNNGASTTYNSPVEVTFNNVSTKYFTHEVNELAANGSQTVLWRVSVKQAGSSTWSEWQYPQSGMASAFKDSYLLDAPVNAQNLVSSSVTDGKSAVASLAWEAGASMSNGLNRYVVEYFQTTETLTAQEIMNRFEKNTKWDGSILNSQYARVEVTNNELTLTGLRDTQYVYWRVRAVDNKDNVSAWTVGDPLHVYLQDQYSPTFGDVPTADQKWVAAYENDDRDPSLRDLFLTWKNATDDKAGVKRYEFKLLGGSAEALANAKYYYSLDGGQNWTEMEYADGIGYIEHVTGIASYQVKVANVGNVNYDWSLTAVDFQNKKTTIASNTSASDQFTGWGTDKTAPQFAQMNKDYVDKVHNGKYTDIAVSMGGTLVDGKYCMTPTFVWTPAGDDLKFNQDNSAFTYGNNGSGVAYYRVEWSMYDKTFHIDIDVDTLKLGSDGKYTWTLIAEEIQAQNLDKVDDKTGYPLVIPNGEYSWKFYAIDNAGNISASISGDVWTQDTRGPEFTGDAEVSVSGTGQMQAVTITWEAAVDYWNLEGDPGAGVHEYELTYTDASGEKGGKRTINAADSSKYFVKDGKTYYSETLYIPNNAYNFTIAAKDICGNEASSTLEGTWDKLEGTAELPAFIIQGSSTVKFDKDLMIGSVAWGPGSYNGIQYFELENYGSTLTEPVRILNGFKGDVSKFSSVANFTAYGTNEWTVKFIGDSEAVYALKYNADGSYTMSRTITVDGKSYDMQIAYGADGKFVATYQMPNGDYAWVLRTKDTSSTDLKIVAGDTWQGDSIAPVIKDSAIDGLLVYDEAASQSNVTIKIDNSQITDAASGVAYYLVEWGTKESGLYDSSAKVDYVAGAYSEKSFAVSGGMTYQYRVTAYDWAGNASVSVGGTVIPDNTAPDFSDDASRPKVSVSIEAGNPTGLSATISWNPAHDGYYDTKDDFGSGVKEYRLYISGIKDPIVITANTKEQDRNTFNCVDTVNNISVHGNWKFTNGIYTVTLSDMSVKGYTWRMEIEDKANNIFEIPSSDDLTNNPDYGKIPGDNRKPSLNVISNNNVSYNIVSNDSELLDVSMKVSLTFSASDEKGGSGLNFYSLAYSADGTEEKIGFGANDYGKWSRNENIYTHSKESYVVVYDASINQYTVTVDKLSIDDHAWTLTVSDYAGNTTREDGIWNTDTAAPEFVNDVECVTGISVTNKGCMSVQLNWTYDPGSSYSDVIDPAVSGSMKNDGAGIESFTLKYRKKGETEWITDAQIKVGKKQSDGKSDVFVITYNDATKKYVASSNSLDAGNYEWTLIARDVLGNESVPGDEHASGIFDGIAPEGEFTMLEYGPAITVDWSVYAEYEHPFYIYTYNVKDISVTFNLENTFTDESGVSYEIRTYGKGASNQERVNMHTFTTTSSTFTLDDRAGKGVGYIANLANNEVFWDVRAIDAYGNVTDWFSGKTFKLVDPLNDDSDHIITDNTAPAAPDALAVADSVEDGKLNLAWGAVADVFGVDRYEVAVYDAAGTELLKTFSAEAADVGLLQLTQNDLDNGDYQFAVRAIDCAGNVSEYSSLFAFTYDVVRPEFDPDSVVCSVSDGSASFTWDGMTDNLAAGKYSILIQRGGIVEVNKEITGTSFVWDNISYYGSYNYTIIAYDAHGNASSSVKSGNFEIKDSYTVNYKWAPVSGIVGGGHGTNTYELLLNGSSADGKYAAAAVTLKVQVLEGQSGVDVFIRDSNGVCIDTVSVGAGSQWSKQYYWNEGKSMSAAYTVEIVSNDPSVNTGYVFSADRRDYTESNVNDNSFAQARDTAMYRIALDSSSGKIIDNEWLGYSDECDFRQITVAQDGIFSFDITGNTAPLNATLWQELNGQLMAVAQGTTSLDNVTLSYGETYYLEIENPGASDVINSNYSVLVSAGISAVSAASPMMDNMENKNNNFLGIA